jgi:membrane protein implicated in regulation of membrane protease activity
MHDEPGAEPEETGRDWHPLYRLLVIPFVALLWPAFYASNAPALIGVPFFYRYQLLWVIIAAVLTAVVYVRTRDERE